MVPPRLTLVSDNTRDMDDSASEDETAIGPATGPGAGPDAGGGGAGLRVSALADPEAAVTNLAARAKREKMRRLEATLFAASHPLDARSLKRCVEADDDVDALLAELQKDYQERGVHLVKVAGKWLFRTADDLSFLLSRETSEERKLSKAGLETLAIIAYHQPVTRAEIEEIRGVSISPGTLDLLMETAWIRPRGRRRAPGRPITYGTTELFLTHFGLDQIKDLPGLADLKASGLLDANLPPGFAVPEPTDIAALMPDELPLEDESEEEQGNLALHEEDEPGIGDEDEMKAGDDAPAGAAKPATDAGEEPGEDA
ncbi:MAG: SMC-Scp complex subunit ScpB [Hyphomicrobium sp.]